MIFHFWNQAILLLEIRPDVASSVSVEEHGPQWSYHSNFRGMVLVVVVGDQGARYP